MYIIVYLNYSDNAITVQRIVDTLEASNKHLSQIAVGFVKQKDGEKNATILTDEMDHSNIFVGYFLHQTSEDTIELYYKKQEKQSGWVSSSLVEKVEKMGRYTVLEYTGVAPVETNTSPVNTVPRRAPIDPHMKADWDPIIQELKEVWAAKNKQKEE